jgi:putative DNA primase/helicase
VRSKNAPNVKCLPKDKFTEAIIFAGADAFAHAQHWSESEGKKAGDDVPPVYLGKNSWWIWKASRLSIVAVNV